MGIDLYQCDTLTERIIWGIIQVHQTLGAGFLESVYRRALVSELRKQGLTTEVEHEVGVYYDGHEVGRHRLDLLVEGQVILELKTVESLSNAHYAQVRSSPSSALTQSRSVAPRRAREYVTELRNRRT